MAYGVLETILMVILAIIFPPLPVLLETGCSTTLLLNIVLTIIGWIPGVIHAIYVSIVLTRPVTTMAAAPGAGMGAAPGRVVV